LSQCPWISGEREWEIGCPQTKARLPVSAINRFHPAKRRQQRQKRKADDGEVVAVDLLEELDPRALDLIGADA
jgi:hypothetical protein